MVEIAFKVAEGTAFYKQFFRAQKEKQKFHDLARAFFERHDLMDGTCQYYQCRALGIEMDDAQKMRFSSQIRKGRGRMWPSMTRRTSLPMTWAKARSPWIM